MTDIVFTQIPVLKDNYTYILHDAREQKTIVIDPAESAPVAGLLRDLEWRATHIINTHHHGDHTGGNDGLKRIFGCMVWAPSMEREKIPGFDNGLHEGTKPRIGRFEFQVLDTPGHTKGHITLVLHSANRIYCGDALFGLGCGGVFEGTFAEMWGSLKKIRDLPDDYLVHCGHEYTLMFSRFAKRFDPDNPALMERIERVKQQRDDGKPTVPFLLGEDKKTNPFLRADDPVIMARLGASDPVECFQKIYEMSD